DELEVIRQAVPGVSSALASLGLASKSHLKVVGIAAQPPLGGRPMCFLTLDGVSALAGQQGLSQIDLALKPGADPASVVRAPRADLPPGTILETTDKIPSGLDRNMKSNQFLLILGTVMAFMCAAFIITTGLMTAVTERQRELAILRCI